MKFSTVVFNLIINFSLLAQCTELFRNGYHRPANVNKKSTKSSKEAIDLFRFTSHKVCNERDVVGHVTVDNTKYPIMLFKAKEENRPYVIWVHETFGESSFLTFKTRDKFPCKFNNGKLNLDEKNWAKSNCINFVLVDLPYHRGRADNFKAASSQLFKFMNQLVLARDLPPNTKLLLLTRHEGAQIVLRAAQHYLQSHDKLFQLKSIILQDPYLSPNPPPITSSDKNDILDYFKSTQLQDKMDYHIRDHTEKSAPTDYDDLASSLQFLQDNDITIQTLTSDQKWPSSLAQYL